MKILTVLIAVLLTSYIQLNTSNHIVNEPVTKHNINNKRNTKCNNTTANKKISKHKYKISHTGKEYIKSKETLSLTPYKIKGEKYYTIGYGHLMINESYQRISKHKANQIFNEDILKTEKSIENILNDFDKRFIYSQGFIDGLGSLIYNCGESGVKNTEFYRRMKACRYDASSKYNINELDLKYAISAIKNDHVYLAGHINRRYEEHLMML